MNKKFISICLCLIVLIFAFTVAVNVSQSNQPLFLAEEEILFPAPAMEPLSPKPFITQLLSLAFPYILAGFIITILIFYAKKHKETVKKYLPKALCALLCVLCVGTSVTFSVSLAETSFSPVSPSDYYGRKQLETMSNSGSLLYAYDQMAEGIENHASEITVNNLFHSVTKDEWLVVLYTYLYDYPQHFWMDSSYRYKYKNGSNGEMIIVQILPNYVFSESELATAKEAFQAEANKILSTLSPSMSEYELELSIHNQLCDRVIYQDAEHAHSAYGGLVTNIAVCEGYGKAFQYLLNQVGIESTLATGVGQPAGSTTPENHAWNFVKINGNYYFTDVTWDDQDEPYYAYFNITTAMLNEDHALANYPYSFPECTALTDNYFTINNAFASSFNLEQVVSLLQYNLKAQIYVTGSASSFSSTLLTNTRAITNQLNLVESSNISISTLGRDKLIKVNGHRRGDVNADNILDQKDVSLLNDYLNNPSAITDETCLKAADYNADGKIDLNDSKKLANYITGIPEEPTSSVPAPSSAPEVSSQPSTSSVPTSSVPVSSVPVSSVPVSSVPVSSVPVSSVPVSSVPVSSVPVSSVPVSSIPAVSSLPETSSSPVIPSEVSSIPSETSSIPSTDEPIIIIKLGDVNKDEAINAKDALIVLKISVNKYKPTEDEKTAANVNKDDSINAKDALEILKKSVGKPACF